MTNVITKGLAVAAIAAFAASAVAGPVKPRIEITTPKVEVLRPGTTISNGQAQQGVTLDVFKGTPAVGAPVVTTNTANLNNSCSVAVIARSFSQRAPKVRESDVAAAIQAGNLKSGNCSAEGLPASVQSNQAVENIAETAVCMTLAGAQSLSGEAYDNVGAGCMLSAKANDAGAVASTVQAELTNFRKINSDCGWFAKN